MAKDDKLTRDERPTTKEEKLKALDAAIAKLEKDFGNAAYATIRAFVMKFASMGLLMARKAGNKVLYRTI